MERDHVLRHARPAARPLGRKPAPSARRGLDGEAAGRARRAVPCPPGDRLRGQRWTTARRGRRARPRVRTRRAARAERADDHDQTAHRSPRRRRAAHRRRRRRRRVGAGRPRADELPRARGRDRRGDDADTPRRSRRAAAPGRSGRARSDSQVHPRTDGPHTACAGSSRLGSRARRDRRRGRPARDRALRDQTDPPRPRRPPGRRPGGRAPGARRDATAALGSADVPVSPRIRLRVVAPRRARVARRESWGRFATGTCSSHVFVLVRPSFRSPSKRAPPRCSLPWRTSAP